MYVSKYDMHRIKTHTLCVYNNNNDTLGSSKDEARNTPYQQQQRCYGASLLLPSCSVMARFFKKGQVSPSYKQTQNYIDDRSKNTIHTLCVCVCVCYTKMPHPCCSPRQQRRRRPRRFPWTKYKNLYIYEASNTHRTHLVLLVRASHHFLSLPSP